MTNVSTSVAPNATQCSDRYGKRRSFQPYAASQRLSWTSPWDRCRRRRSKTRSRYGPMALGYSRTCSNPERMPGASSCVTGGCHALVFPHSQADSTDIKACLGPDRISRPTWNHLWLIILAPKVGEALQTDRLRAVLHSHIQNN